METKFIRRLCLVAIAMNAVAANALAQNGSSRTEAAPALSATKNEVRERVQTLAWETYIEEMSGRVSISETESVQSAEELTLGVDIPKFAWQGDKIWEVRIADKFLGVRAILWVYAPAQRVRILVAPSQNALKTDLYSLQGIFGFGFTQLPTALPSVETMTEITLNHGNSGEKLSVEKWKQLMKTAHVVSDEEWNREYRNRAIPGYSKPTYWYKGFFTTPSGLYRFGLQPFGDHYLIAPNGTRMHLKFAQSGD